MKHYCKNHPNKIALSLCHSCGAYYCSDCLNEGLEYYYCTKGECNNIFLSESINRINADTKTKSLSKESKFIKQTAIVLLLLSFFALVYSTIKAYDSYVILNFINLYKGQNKSEETYINFLKYFSGLSFLSVIIMSFSLITSIRSFFFKSRVLLIVALLANILLIVLYNILFYSYAAFTGRESLLAYGEHSNYWSLKSYTVAAISALLIMVIGFLIAKYSSKNIKKVFIKK
jgi:hypothetical protein